MDPPPMAQSVPLPPPVAEFPRPPNMPSSIPLPPPIPSFLSGAGIGAPPETARPPTMVAAPKPPPVFGGGMPIPPTVGISTPRTPPTGGALQSGPGHLPSEPVSKSPCGSGIVPLPPDVTNQNTPQTSFHESVLASSTFSPGPPHSSSAKASVNAPPKEPFGVSGPEDPFSSASPQRISQDAPVQQDVPPQQPITPSAPTDYFSTAPQQRFSHDAPAQVNAQTIQLPSPVPPPSVPPQGPFSESARTDPFSPAPQQRFSHDTPAQVNAQTSQFSSPVPPPSVPPQDPFSDSARADPFSPAPQQRFSHDAPAQVNAQTNQFFSPVPPPSVPPQDPFSESARADPFSPAPQQRFSHHAPAQVNAQTDQFFSPVPPPSVPPQGPFSESARADPFSSAPQQRFSQDAPAQVNAQTNQFSSPVPPPSVLPQDPFSDSARADPFSPAPQQRFSQDALAQVNAQTNQFSSPVPPPGVPPPQEPISASTPTDPFSPTSQQSQDYHGQVSAQGSSFPSPDQSQSFPLQGTFDVSAPMDPFSSHTPGQGSSKEALFGVHAPTDLVSSHKPPPQGESQHGLFGVNAPAGPFPLPASSLGTSSKALIKGGSKASLSSVVSSLGVPSRESLGRSILSDPFSSRTPSRITRPQEPFGKSIPTDPFSSPALPLITPSQEPFGDLPSADSPGTPGILPVIMEQQNQESINNSLESSRTPGKFQISRSVSFSNEPPVMVPPPNPHYPQIAPQNLGFRTQGRSVPASHVKENESSDASASILRPSVEGGESYSSSRMTSVDFRVTACSPVGNVGDTSKIYDFADHSPASASPTMFSPTSTNLTQPEYGAGGTQGSSLFSTPLPNDNSNTVRPPSTANAAADVAPVDGPRQGVVVVTGFGGKMLLCNQTRVEIFALRDVISGSSDVNAVKVRELDQFPGPLGFCDKHTTAKLITFFENSERNTVHVPPSDALMNRLLLELLRADGNRDTAFATFVAYLGEPRDNPANPHAPLRQMTMDLAQGRVDLALEQGACSNMMWPHVLVVSELVSRDAFLHSMARFATFMGTGEQPVAVNGPANDPYVKGLKQLYGLLSQETPVDKLVEEVVDCWQPSVALITTLLRRAEDSDQHAFLVEKYLVALGNKLAATPNNDPTAAHICFLLTKVHQLESVDTASGVMAILGVEHRDPDNFTKLLNTQAFHWTETYEYITRLTNKDYVAIGFQPFKMVHAMTLADYGMQDKAQKYLDMTNAFVKAIPSIKYCDSFRTSLRELSEQLKPSDVHPLNVNGHKFFAADVVEGVAGGVGNLFAKGAGIFKNVGAVTGLTTKPIGPPALGDSNDEDASDYGGAPGGFVEPSFGQAPGGVRPPSEQAPGKFAPPSEEVPSGFGPLSGQLPSGFGPPPRHVSDGFGPPPEQVPSGFGPPSGQASGGFGPPPGQTPGGFRPPSGQTPGGFPPPPGQTPGGFPSSPEQTPGGFRPPSGQTPGGFGPPGQSPSGFGPPPGQAPGGFGPPPGQKPGGFGPPPVQTPSGFGSPPGQAPGGFGPPSGQAPSGFGPPPGQAPGEFGPPPGQRPGGFEPPVQTPGGFGPPPGQAPGGFGPPPSVDQTRAGFVQVPSNQQASGGSWPPATSQQTAGGFATSPPTASGSWTPSPLAPRPPSGSMPPLVQNINTPQPQAPLSPLMPQRGPLSPPLAPSSAPRPPWGVPPMGSYPPSSAPHRPVDGPPIGGFSPSGTPPPPSPTGGSPMLAAAQYNALQPPTGAPPTIGSALYNSVQPTVGASYSSNPPNDPSYTDPAQPRRDLMPVDDPIVNAGKAVWGGVSSIWKGITQVAQMKQGDDDVYDKIGEKQTMYYDPVSARWREHGKEDLDISQYDAHTGRVITPPPQAPPPPPSDSAIGGGPQTAFAGRGRRGLGAANLYVTPSTHPGSGGYY